MALRQTTDLGKISFCLKRGDFAVNRCIADLDLPDDVNIVWIERTGKSIIPCGYTGLMSGDRIVARGKREKLSGIEAIFKGKKNSKDVP